MIRGYINIIKYLVEHGADINKESCIDKAPIFIACNKRHENIIKCLEEYEP